ncbi:MAG: PH domain-containing protein [Phaeodactylibacter sp.]|nr:PH domain-containing protein [Phaeodactylibacter sp.]
MEDPTTLPTEPEQEPPRFENPVLDLQHIPQVDPGAFQSLAPTYLRLLYIRTSIFFVIMLIGSIILILSTDLAQISRWFWGGPGVLGIFFLYALFLVRRRYRHEGYQIRAHDLLHRKGVLWQVQTGIPFNRIQHCSLHQGPIEKRFRLATLQIFTAGGQGSDLSIAGLGREQADQLKDFLLQKMGQDED